jgi:hypothetical protein
MEKNSQLKAAMTYGGIYGLAVCVVTLIFYFIGMDLQSSTPRYLTYAILIIAIVMGIKGYRDNNLGGFIPYGKAVSTGTLIGLFGGIITGAFSVLMFTVIDPDLLEKIMVQATEQLEEQGQSEEQIEMATNWTRKLMSPLFLFIASVLSSAIMSIIISLIAAAFLKKEKNPFSNQMA